MGERRATGNLLLAIEMYLLVQQEFIAPETGQSEPRVPVIVLRQGVKAGNRSGLITTMIAHKSQQTRG
jgi:hypothetical protein